MSLTVCLAPTGTLNYQNGGGHLWAYLNWAFGLRGLGCRVIWLEAVDPKTPASIVQAGVAGLKRRLARYGFHEVGLYCWTGGPLEPGAAAGCLDLDAAAEADLLLNVRYETGAEVIRRFRRSVLLDIDPGLLQSWLSAGQIQVARHDFYFSIGETVGSPEARFSDAGLKWRYTPPCVALDAWATRRADEPAPFTTLSHWYSRDYVKDGDEVYSNEKRSAFLPFLDLPRRTAQPLELALRLAGDEAEQRRLESHGWRVVEAHDVAAMPWDYQRYLQASRGEFSCAKPAYRRLETAWVSDRTLCYLASGKPAVVEHTGRSRFLPDAAGLFRFRTIDEAARCLNAAAAEYERHSRLARALAEEYFDARKVVGRVLERALA